MQPGNIMCFLRKPLWNFPIDMWPPLMGSELSCQSIPKAVLDRSEKRVTYQTDMYLQAKNIISLQSIVIVLPSSTKRISIHIYQETCCSTKSKYQLLTAAETSLAVWRLSVNLWVLSQLGITLDKSARQGGLQDSDSALAFNWCM